MSRKCTPAVHNPQLEPRASYLSTVSNSSTRQSSLVTYSRLVLMHPAAHNPLIRASSLLQSARQQVLHPTVEPPTPPQSSLIHSYHRQAFYPTVEPHVSPPPTTPQLEPQASYTTHDSNPSIPQSSLVYPNRLQVILHTVSKCIPRLSGSDNPDCQKVLHPTVHNFSIRASSLLSPHSPEPLN